MGAGAQVIRPSFAALPGVQAGSRIRLTQTRREREVGERDLSSVDSPPK